MWSVIGGAIVGRGRSGESSHLFHRAEFKNFQIEAEVKINETGNSGLYLRASREERNGAPDGYEIQIIGEVAGRGTPEPSLVLCSVSTRPGGWTHWRRYPRGSPQWRIGSSYK